MPAARNRVQQYSGPNDLLERLARDLQRLQLASTPAAALDAALTFACTAWSLTAWLYAPIYRDPQVRRQLAHLVDRGMSSIDLEVFGGLVAELCPNLALCADIAADPSSLAVESTGAGWLLFLIEDGERRPIDLQRFANTLIFWRRFVRKYLADAPSFGLGSRYAAGRARSNGKAHGWAPHHW